MEIKNRRQLEHPERIDAVLLQSAKISVVATEGRTDDASTPLPGGVGAVVPIGSHAVRRWGVRLILESLLALLVDLDCSHSAGDHQNLGRCTKAARSLGIGPLNPAKLEIPAPGN